MVEREREREREERESNMVTERNQIDIEGVNEVRVTW